MRTMICAALALSGVASVAHAGEAKPAATQVASPTSVLEGYRRYEELPPIDWRRANEEAATLGGHVGQIRGKSATAPRERHSHGHMKEGGRR